MGHGSSPEKGSEIKLRKIEQICFEDFGSPFLKAWKVIEIKNDADVLFRVMAE
jgi:hypothetical protein